MNRPLAPQPSVRRSLVLAIAFSLFHTSAHAWGKWGHAAVGSTAAAVLSGEPEGGFLKRHAYDMGYYNNVPDLVWKSTPEMYKVEWTQHFVDLEIFAREMKGEKEWLRDRLAFRNKYPEIPETAGWAFWRIEELNRELIKTTTQLKNSDPTADSHKDLQGRWLLLAGTMGHYVADLSQPLHCSENYDGQLSEQKGVHAFFEDDLVDELHPELEVEVLKRAQKQWRAFRSKNEKTEVFDLMRALCEDSLHQLPKLLALDKKTGRKDPKKAARVHRDMIYDRLALGSLYLAEVWRRQLGWTYQGEKFYQFHSRPDPIRPPIVPESKPNASQKKK